MTPATKQPEPHQCDTTLSRASNFLKLYNLDIGMRRPDPSVAVAGKRGSGAGGCMSCHTMRWPDLRARKEESLWEWCSIITSYPCSARRDIPGITRCFIFSLQTLPCSHPFLLLFPFAKCCISPPSLIHLRLSISLTPILVMLLYARGKRSQEIDKMKPTKWTPSQSSGTDGPQRSACLCSSPLDDEVYRLKCPHATLKLGP